MPRTAAVALRRARRVRAWWHDPPTVMRATIARGKTEREVGPRGSVDVDEAAALLDLTPAKIRTALRLGHLRGRGHPVRVTLRELAEYREDRDDAAAAKRALREARRVGFVPYEDVRRRIGLA